MDTLNGSGGGDAPEMCFQQQLLKIKKKNSFKKRGLFFFLLKMLHPQFINIEYLLLAQARSLCPSPAHLFPIPATSLFAKFLLVVGRPPDPPVSEEVQGRCAAITLHRDLEPGAETTCPLLVYPAATWPEDDSEEVSGSPKLA